MARDVHQCPGPRKASKRQNSRNTPADNNVIYMDNVQHPPVSNIQVSALVSAVREREKLPRASRDVIQGVGQRSLSVELGLLLSGPTTEANSNLTPTALNPTLNPGELTADTSPCLTSTKRLIQRGKDGFTKDNTYLDNIFSSRGLHVLHLNVHVFEFAP